MNNIFLSAMQKQAGEATQYSDIEKKAAYDQLIEAGVDFDKAIELIQKEAGILGSAKAIGAGAMAKIRSAGGAIKADAGKVGGQIHNVRQSAKNNGGVFNKGTGSTLKALGKNKAVLAGGAALATAGAAGAAASGREKQACVQLLMDQGIDFETAVELTKQAEVELYGK